MSILIRSLSKYFENEQLFNDLNLDIPFDVTSVITGPSGCGKTTLLRIISGLDNRFSGKITGVPYAISFMFQEDRLLPWFTLKQNLEFVLKDIMDKPQMDVICEEMIDAVQLTGHENKYPENLSGGMKRRAAMARAYCYPSELLLMDEPFKGLDAKLKDDMMSLFERLYVKKNKTTLLVSHDEAVLKRFQYNEIALG